MVDLLRALRQRDDRAGSRGPAPRGRGSPAFSWPRPPSSRIRSGSVPPSSSAFPYRRRRTSAIIAKSSAPGHGADLEALVVVLLHAAGFPDDHGADRLLPLDVRDVEALDAGAAPPGARAPRRSSSTTTWRRLDRARRWVWRARAAFSSAMATSSRFRPRWGTRSSTRPSRSWASHSPSSDSSGTSAESRTSRGGITLFE